MMFTNLFYTDKPTLHWEMSRDIVMYCYILFAETWSWNTIFVLMRVTVTFFSYFVLFMSSFLNKYYNDFVRYTATKLTLFLFCECSVTTEQILLLEMISREAFTSTFWRIFTYLGNFAKLCFPIHASLLNFLNLFSV